MVNLIVYYSSNTGYTHRFIEKLGIPSVRIPQSRKEEIPVITEPYVLIIPTYGGGVGISNNIIEEYKVNDQPVLPQIYDFLDYEDNYKYMCGVVASGNRNFGEDYGVAADQIRDDYGVLSLYRFELLGTDTDVSVLSRGIPTLNPEELLKNNHPRK